MTTSIVPPSILLADGDDESRRAFGEFFRQEGWCFDVVMDGGGVAGAVGKQEYDIVILDVAMATTGGFGLLTDILRDRPGQAIIAVSPDASFDEALKFFRLGATDLLARPIDFEWLGRVVRQVVQDRRIDERMRQLYRFVTSERTEIRLTCRQLVELGTVSLPIVDRLMLGRMLDQGSALRFKLAVQEAINNALEHGNLELSSEWREEIHEDGGDRFSVVRRERLQDPDFANRCVTVQSWFDGVRLEVTVKDDGQGFLNGAKGGSGEQERSALACSGRGLSLMFSAVDEVKFDRNGSEVTLLKYLRRNGG